MVLRDVLQEEFHLNPRSLFIPPHCCCSDVAAHFQGEARGQRSSCGSVLFQHFVDAVSRDAENLLGGAAAQVPDAAVT